MNALDLRLKSGVTLAVPGTLSSMTTYVLLEQEQWFEKEVDFLLQWLRPGMTVIDIGANLGVYSLPMARRVGPHGHVFAYEPASEPRAFLERSREINRADNLHIVAAAVSDVPREGHLVIGLSSELNSLSGSGPGEAVRITTLDEEDRTRGWSAVDFIKIDAEGEEERILAGGKAFFARHSPLVQFEIQVDNRIDDTLLSVFPRHGYGIYRLLAGAPVIVRVEAGAPLDAFELNLFAAKPDRAAALARDGFLLDAVPGWAPDATARAKAVDMIRAQAFAAAFAPLFPDDATLDATYRDGLAGYATWRSSDLPLAERVAALQFACATLRRACESLPSLARFSSLARAAWDAGERAVCVTALKGFADAVQRGEMKINEPFWPAGARFDGMHPGPKRGEWVLATAFEQWERASSHSSLFSDPLFDLGWLCAQPFASVEMERRRVLRAAIAGQRAEIPARLCSVASDHLNTEVWRAGLVSDSAPPAAEAG